MPRARPGARKSTARRRIQRYRSKWTHHVLPVRIKELLPHMEEAYEETEPPFVECEEPTMAKLEELGVPTAEWPYYIGFMKRMLRLYNTYTELTLLIERAMLLTEYYLRGHDLSVLAAIDEVAAGCAEVPYVHVITCDDVKACLTIITCEDVRACLEGDYSTWTLQWEVDYRYPIQTIEAYEAQNKLVLVSADDDVRTMRLSDGALLAILTDVDQPFYYPNLFASVLKKYMVITTDPGGVPTINIFKDGAIVQTTDLFALLGWNATIFAAFSSNGKYLAVYCGFAHPVYVYKLALFKGS